MSADADFYADEFAKHRADVPVDSCAQVSKPHDDCPLAWHPRHRAEAS